MPWLSVDYTHSALEDSQTRDGQGRHPRWPEHRYHSAEMYKQHLDNLRRKDSLTGAETPERAVRLGNYSASHFEGAAYRAPGGRWRNSGYLLKPTVSPPTIPLVYCP